MEDFIRATGLVKNYTLGSHVIEALRGVSLAVRKGEFLVLMGPSGSGKSTLLHIMGCLDHPTSGTLTIQGKDVIGLNDNSRAVLRNRDIGFVFQQFNLLPRTTALSNVELPLLYAGVGSGERKRRAREALDRVGLSHRISHYPSQLSGGEQQRVAIARALVNDPGIILADEPTGNLDTRSGMEILNELDELNAQGMTLVMVTHEREVADHGDRILEMRDGLVTANGSTSGDRRSGFVEEPPGRGDG
jgi:putative ABC transport system ATP-binding protein